MEKTCLPKRRNVGTGGRTRTHNVDTNVPRDDFKVQLNEDSLYSLNSTHTISSVSKIMVPLRIQGKSLQFEVDSDAACSIISLETYRRTWPDRPLTLSRANL